MRKIARVDQLVLRDLLTRYSASAIRRWCEAHGQVCCPTCQGRTYTGPLESAVRCARCGGKGTVRHG